MAIRVPNLGLGDGKTGDTELKIRQDYNHNFNDQTNAASRLVGTETGRIPLAEQTYKSAFSIPSLFIDSGANPDNFLVGTRNSFPIASHPALKALLNSEYAVIVDTIAQTTTGIILQIGWSWTTGTMITRTKVGTWSEWKLASTAIATYNTTTALGANTVIDVSGKLMRSTSSERYKDILAPLELDDARYADAMSIKPIVYRSTADADNPQHHFYSFSAEELGAYDPAFTLWRTTEMVTDAEGDTTEQPLAERQAEGININALLAMSHAIAIKQDKLIKALLARIEILEAK